MPEAHCDADVQPIPGEERQTPPEQAPLPQSVLPLQPPVPSGARQMPPLHKPLQHSALVAQSRESSTHVQEPSPWRPQHVRLPVAGLVVQGPRQQSFGSVHVYPNEALPLP
jgi:hypothetical protein